MSGPGSCEVDDDMGPLVFLFLTLLNANTWPPVAGRRPTVWSGPWWWRGEGVVGICGALLLCALLEDIKGLLYCDSTRLQPPAAPPDTEVRLDVSGERVLEEGESMGGTRASFQRTIVEGLEASSGCMAQTIGDSILRRTDEEESGKINHLVLYRNTPEYSS
ncbi:hypothetical protein NQZ68_018973 [Dissostichus eleginoides]|nr:hypothetical protein NQZ68_018973 [Dissostichus eleginoides]